MPVPAFRTSPSRKRKRRSHHAISAKQTVLCANCGAAKHPHQACRSCGYVRPGLKIRASKDE